MCMKDYWYSLFLKPLRSGIETSGWEAFTSLNCFSCGALVQCDVDCKNAGVVEVVLFPELEVVRIRDSCLPLRLNFPWEEMIMYLYGYHLWDRRGMLWVLICLLCVSFLCFCRGYLWLPARAGSWINLMLSLEWIVWSSTVFISTVIPRLWYF